MVSLQRIYQHLKGNQLTQLAFESVVHMGEETRDAKRAVPRAVFWSVATNVALGLVMIITFGVSRWLGPLEHQLQPSHNARLMPGVTDMHAFYRHPLGFFEPDCDHPSEHHRIHEGYHRYDIWNCHSWHFWKHGGVIVCISFDMGVGAGRR